MPNEGRKIGDWGERQAVRFLERQGFEIIEKNYNSTVGEIDIVARKGDDIYFIEVKTRMSEEFARDESITSAKLKKFQKTVRKYCYEREVSDELGIVLAGLVVFVKKIEKTVKFRLFVINNDL